MNWLNTKVIVCGYTKAVFAFEHTPLQQDPVSKSMKRFVPNIIIGRTLLFSCLYLISHVGAVRYYKGNHYYLSSWDLYISCLFHYYLKLLTGMLANVAFINSSFLLNTLQYIQPCNTNAMIWQQ